MSRLLHEPTIRLRSFGEDHSHASLELVRELFALSAEAPAEQQPAAEMAEVHELRSRQGSGQASRRDGSGRAPR